jgi:Family of unknown function (DUF5683)
MLNRIIATAFALLCPFLLKGAVADSAVLSSKDPTKAVWMSLACPGLGQLYTEQYWKIPLFAGAAGASAVLFFVNNASYNDAVERIDAAIAAGRPAFEVDRIRRERNAARGNRDLAAGVFLLTYALAAVDAYVGAHLYDFDVSDDLSLRIGPTQTSPAALTLAVRF